MLVPTASILNLSEIWKKKQMFSKVEITYVFVTYEIIMANNIMMLSLSLGLSIWHSQRLCPTTLQVWNLLFKYFLV